MTARGSGPAALERLATARKRHLAALTDLETQRDQINTQLAVCGTGSAGTQAHLANDAVAHS